MNRIFFFSPSICVVQISKYGNCFFNLNVWNKRGKISETGVVCLRTELYFEAFFPPFTISETLFSLQKIGVKEKKKLVLGLFFKVST